MTRTKRRQALWFWTAAYGQNRQAMSSLYNSEQEARDALNACNGALYHYNEHDGVQPYREILLQCGDDAAVARIRESIRATPGEPS